MPAKKQRIQPEYGVDAVCIQAADGRTVDEGMDDDDQSAACVGKRMCNLLRQLPCQCSTPRSDDLPVFDVLYTRKHASRSFVSTAN